MALLREDLHQACSPTNSDPPLQPVVAALRALTLKLQGLAHQALRQASDPCRLALMAEAPNALLFHHPEESDEAIPRAQSASDATALRDQAQ